MRPVTFDLQHGMGWQGCQDKATLDPISNSVFILEHESYAGISDKGEQEHNNLQTYFTSQSFNPLPNSWSSMIEVVPSV
jgi:hypothetical protein